MGEDQEPVGEREEDGVGACVEGGKGAVDGREVGR